MDSENVLAVEPKESPPTCLPVFIVHWSAPQWCRTATESILRSEGLRAVVTVIDNGGGPLMLPDAVKVITAPSNLGYTGGANLALARWLLAGDTYCVIGSHDLVVEPSTLARLVAGAEAHRDFGIIGSDRLGLHELGPPSADGVVEQRYVTGVCMLLRRECIEEIGIFDEDYGSYCEDVDLCYRAKDHGWKVGAVKGAFVMPIGTISPIARRLIAVNSVLLDAKRGGIQGALLALSRLAWRATRDTVLSAVPLRTRKQHWQRAIDQMTALPIAGVKVVRMIKEGKCRSPRAMKRGVARQK